MAPLAIVMLNELHQQLKELGPCLTLLCLVSVATPFVLYTYCWHYPIRFSTSRWPHYISLPSMKDEPVKRLQWIATWLKIPQLLGIFLLSAGFRWPFDFPHVDWLFFVGMGACSYMDYAIVNAIGYDGMFYGVRLGKDIPWVVGFPFDLGVSDPQYRSGQVRALLMAYAFRTPGSYLTSLYVVALYQYMSAVEANIPDTPPYLPEPRTTLDSTLKDTTASKESDKKTTMDKKNNSKKLSKNKSKKKKVN